MLDELKLNGQKYYDPTAYKAIVNVMKEEKSCMAKYNDGDIVIAAINGMPRIEYLLIRCFDGYATAYRLLGTPPTENSNTVRSRQLRYYDAGKFNFVYYDNIEEYVRTLSDDEMAEVRFSIVETLDLFLDERWNDSEDTPLVEPVVPDDKKLLDVIGSVNEKLGGYVDDAKNIIRLEAERDVYKGLYLDLLKKEA